MKTNMNKLVVTGVLAGAWLLVTNAAFAHCDTVDGPVVTAAKMALEKKEIAPVLKWIKAKDESELTAAFVQTLTVRSLGKEARELADQFFFETLVRLHRQAEGAPYTGLKPADSKPDSAIQAADQALQTGKSDTLIRTLTQEVEVGIRKRFDEVLEKKRHAEHNVEAGREYVAAYVEFVHYVEALHATAIGTAQAHEQEASVRSAKAAHEHTPKNQD